MGIDAGEDEEDELGRRPLIRDNAVVFDASQDQRNAPRAPMSDMPRAVQAAQERDEEDMWASLG